MEPAAEPGSEGYVFIVCVSLCYDVILLCSVVPHCCVLRVSVNPKVSGNFTPKMGGVLMRAKAAREGLRAAAAAAAGAAGEEGGGADGTCDCWGRNTSFPVLRRARARVRKRNPDMMKWGVQGKNSTVAVAVFAPCSEFSRAPESSDTKAAQSAAARRRPTAELPNPPRRPH